ncbi:MAG TPA: CBS domain-containing protein, partial [Acidimicrobiales bacterium]|nr:CBS domain-containing protein [Acidimicrobiales bacterium]
MTTKTATVGDAMSEPAITATLDETLATVAARMTREGIGSVVITEANRPVGIVTERDILRATATGVSPDDADVQSWMTADPECLSPDASIDEAWTQLAERGYRHVPVVAGGELKGILSMRDLVALAQLRPADESAVTAPPGLKGVVVAETALGDVRGLEGFYHYRQYAAPELAATRSFEDVWHLLIEGELPTAAERAAFAAEVAPLRHLPDVVADALPGIANSTPSPA